MLYNWLIKIISVPWDGYLCKYIYRINLYLKTSNRIVITLIISKLYMTNFLIVSTLSFLINKFLFLEKPYKNSAYNYKNSNVIYDRREWFFIFLPFRCVPCPPECDFCEAGGICQAKRDLYLKSIILSLQLVCMAITVVLALVVFKQRKCKVSYIFISKLYYTPKAITF